MWGKTLAFIVIFILVFGILVAWVPDYFSLGIETQDTEAQDEINAADLILYSNSGSDTMTYEYSSLTDHPDAPQFNSTFPEGEYLEVWWGISSIPDVGPIGKNIELRHSKDWFWGFQMISNLVFYFANGSTAGIYINKDLLEQAWTSETNSSIFYATGDGVSVSIIFKPSTDVSIGESWDNDELYYGLSYEWNPDATGFNVLALITKLLTFHGLGVGVPGILGNFIDVVLSTLFYIAICIIAYIIITSVIPLVPGAPDT